MRPSTSWRAIALASTFAFGLPAAKAAAEVNVVATIPAVHSIVSGVMGDTGQPHLLIPGGSSPHTYSLKPSNARALAESELVVWVGPQLEAFLDGELDDLAPDAQQLALQSLDGATRLSVREGGLWDAHDHSSHGGHDHGKDHHDHEAHDDHADKHGDHDHQGHKEEAHHDDHHDDHAHDHDDHADKHEDHDHHGHKEEAHHDDHHDDHAHGHGEHGEDAGVDAHMWLDPGNAIALSAAIADALSKIDADNASVYSANHASQAEALTALDSELKSQLEKVKSEPFIVFHDAYQYFETHYGLRGVGSVTVSPEVAPGAARVRAIQERITDRSAQCVFAEPQFKPSILTAVTEGTSARTGVLDPLGAEIEPGADMYAQLMRKLASDLVACLADPA